jgi:hypothetical protein
VIGIGTERGLRGGDVEVAVVGEDESRDLLFCVALPIRFLLVSRSLLPFLTLSKLQCIDITTCSIDSNGKFISLTLVTKQMLIKT